MISLREASDRKERAQERVQRAWQEWNRVCARPGVTELEKHEAWAALRQVREKADAECGR